MLIRDAFIWLGDTGAGRFLAESTTSFAVVQAAHILSFGLLGGAVLAVDLAAVGLIFRQFGAVRLARAIMPVFALALVGAVVTGVLLVAAGPLNYYANALFPWKLGALVIAVVIHFAIYPGTRIGAPDVSTIRLRVAVLGAVSLIAWLVVTVIGRWLGLI